MSFTTCILACLSVFVLDPRAEQAYCNAAAQQKKMQQKKQRQRVTNGVVRERPGTELKQTWLLTAGTIDAAEAWQYLAAALCRRIGKGLHPPRFCFYFANADVRPRPAIALRVLIVRTKLLPKTLARDGKAVHFAPLLAVADFDWDTLTFVLLDLQTMRSGTEKDSASHPA